MDQLSVDGSPFFDNLWVVWPVRQIVDENIAFRRSAIEKRLNCAGQEVVYIASAGVDGILFGIEATFKQRDDAQIVSWYPIGQRTSCLADTLGGFLDGWLCNRISV